MLKVYYCKFCERIFYIQYENDTACRACGRDLFKLSTSFSHYTSMTPSQRKGQLMNELLTSEYYYKF